MGNFDTYQVHPDYIAHTIHIDNFLQWHTVKRQFTRTDNTLLYA